VSAIDDAYARIAALEDPAVVVSMLPRELLREPARGPLHGLPVLVKDNIAVRTLPTGAACPAFAAANGPARASAAVVELLEAAGAVVIGTTNMDQFATGLVGTRSPYGAPLNPRAPDRIPGGSSSGAAVAVARGLVPLAIGTDTAGSGRVPAACTGTVGYKPTRALVDMAGIVPAVAGVDCISIHARTVAVAWHALRAIAAPPARPDVPLRIGRVPRTVVQDRCEPAIAAAYGRTCAAADAHTEIDLDPFFAAGALLYGPFVAARTAAFGEFLTAHPHEVDPNVAAIVARGASVTGAEVFAAHAELATLKAEAHACLAGVDVVLTPTVPCFPTLAEVAAEPLAVNARLSCFTDFANLLDLCAFAVPRGDRTDGLPFGVSVLARAGADADAARVAARLTGETIAVAEPAVRARVAVVGAHLRGLPLHGQLVALGAELYAVTRTAPTYRLYALAGTHPAKPGLVRDPTGGAIECEVYEMGEAELGRFLTHVDAPLALGPVELEDGALIPGFLATEGALSGAADITEYGGWRAYLAGAKEAV
jgi:allophanate hydrolase